MGRIWRVRWWVRLLSVAVPVLMLPFLAWPHVLSPDWREGMPASEWAWAAGFQVVLWLLALSAFISRVELANGTVRLVNPWGIRTFPASDVVSVRPGGLGLEFVLPAGRVAVAFAVQSTAAHAGSEPRWVEIAKAVTGRDPEPGFAG